MIWTQRQALLNNSILGALGGPEMARILPEMELIAVRRNAVIHEAGQPFPFVFFPAGGFISLVLTGGHAEEIEVGMVGREGLVGVPVLLGAEEASMTAVAQSDATGIGMKPHVFRQFLKRDERAADHVRHYAQAFLVMLAQGCLCNQEHLIEQRLARWLLMAKDRAETEALWVTQETFSRLLGVRRASVSECLEKMQDRGVLAYHRGEVAILDRRRLEGLACDCYRVIRRELERVRPETPAKPAGTPDRGMPRRGGEVRQHRSPDRGRTL